MTTPLASSSTDAETMQSTSGGGGAGLSSSGDQAGAAHKGIIFPRLDVSTEGPGALDEVLNNNRKARRGEVGSDFQRPVQGEPGRTDDRETPIVAGCRSATPPQTLCLNTSNQDRSSLDVADQSHEHGVSTSSSNECNLNKDSLKTSNDGTMTTATLAAMTVPQAGAVMVTSTPLLVGGRTEPRRNFMESGAPPASPVGGASTDQEPEEDLTASTSSSTRTDRDAPPPQLQVPIIGYEVMEERARFTVFKIYVKRTNDEGWFIFRRYNDFFRLNQSLGELFPHFRLALPPKRWFGDNYDRDFLDDRLLGLQAFLDNIVGHRDVCNSEPVNEFLCLDDPPGPYDSLEESRGRCENLESEVYSLRRDMRDRDSKISLLSEELKLCREEVENLKRSLRAEKSLSRGRRSSVQRSKNSLLEHEQSLNAVGGDPGSGASSKSSTVTSPDSMSSASLGLTPTGPEPAVKLHNLARHTGRQTVDADTLGDYGTASALDKMAASNSAPAAGLKNDRRKTHPQLNGGLTINHLPPSRVSVDTDREIDPDKTDELNEQVCTKLSLNSTPEHPNSPASPASVSRDVRAKAAMKPAKIHTQEGLAL